MIQSKKNVYSVAMKKRYSVTALMAIRKISKTAEKKVIIMGLWIKAQEERNRFHFDLNCIIYNIFRANYVLERTA